LIHLPPVTSGGPYQDRELLLQELAEAWPGEWHQEGILLGGWQLMGMTVFRMVWADLPRVLVPMGGLVILSLALAFRKAGEVLLSLATLLVSALALWAVMGLAGWSWNLMNMMALPLLLGAGIDYSIHMQLGLRRHHDNIRLLYRSIGRALLLCAGTTFTAFASLAFSSTAGLASLGRVCAAGILCACLTAVLLLPAWWLTLYRNRLPS